MRPSAQARTLFALSLAFGFAARTARALVTLNDGTDKIFVAGTFTMGIDSNIAASAQNVSDTTY